MYLHEELSQYKLNSQYALKDMKKKRKPSDIVAAKISFLMNLYKSKNKLILDPTDNIEHLKMMIDVTK